jgi:hypothetical protein
MEKKPHALPDRVLHIENTIEDQVSGIGTKMMEGKTETEGMAMRGIGIGIGTGTGTGDHTVVGVETGFRIDTERRKRTRGDPNLVLALVLHLEEITETERRKGLEVEKGTEKRIERGKGVKTETINRAEEVVALLDQNGPITMGRVLMELLRIKVRLFSQSFLHTFHPHFYPLRY